MKATIYTGVGDSGETRLLGNVKTSKDDPRVEVYGTLDEATSALGLARATTCYADLCRLIIELQEELIPVMSEVATPPDGALTKPALPQVKEEQVLRLEKIIDTYNQEWIQSGQFITPGGSQASAAFDLARTIVRRAERRLVSLSRITPVNPHLLKYLNRLSDLLYVLGRIDEQRTLKKIVKDTLQSQAIIQSLQLDISDISSKKRGDKMNLNLTDSNRMIEAGIQRALQIGTPMVLSVVDGHGEVVQTCRMDNALLVSVTLAPKKACTAAIVRIATHELAKLSQPGQPLFHIDVNQEKLTLVGGGFPVLKDGVVVGGVGVSGGSVEQDIAV
ncbi:MAG: cob(I)yrinic acid a,c-diamide adenosyltransferase, partial [Chloroflexota bacterium]